MENNELKPDLKSENPKDKEVKQPSGISSPTKEQDVVGKTMETGTAEQDAVLTKEDAETAEKEVADDTIISSEIDVTEEVHSVKIDEGDDVPVTQNEAPKVTVDKGFDVASQDEQTEILKEKKDLPEKVEIDKVEHDHLSKKDLIARLNYLLEHISAKSTALKDEVEAIKVSFYKQHKKEVQEIKVRFVADGGDEKDFMAVPDPQEILLKELMTKFKGQRASFQRTREAEKAENLKLKYEIIEEIKVLQLGEESLNKTFKVFRELQDKWREAGPVPQAQVKNLYETYHHHVELFYDYIKINKELRDLDLKKNYELKVELCVKAEELVSNVNVMEAFAELQNLHHEWREIGPVQREEREVLWDRFKLATAAINKKHQQHYEEIKNSQKDNLDKKTLLCEKVEAFAALKIEKNKDWNQKSDEIMELQKEWRAIGFAPKKYNTRIYERFRAACDAFFNRKREFYQEYKNLQDENYAKKLELIKIAEGLKDSTKWKEDSDKFIKIQKEWKSIGPVARKHSDAIWKSFRSACDHFFQQKANYFKNIDKVYDENLEKKKQLIEEIKLFELTDDNDAMIQKIESFKHRWNDIGHVPFKDKESIYNEFRGALNAHYDHLQIDESTKEVIKFKSKVDDMQQGSNSYDKVSSERLRLMAKLKKLESEISVWENNIGFFASSKKSDSLLKDFQHKIDEAKERKEVLIRKIKFIDSM